MSGSIYGVIRIQFEINPHAEKILCYDWNNPR